MGLKLVNIDEELHKQVSKIVEEQPVDYPSIQFYVSQAVKEKLRIDTIRAKEQQQ